MRAAVLGSGLMGSVIGLDLARSEGVDSVVVADIDPDRLKAVKRRAASKKLSTELLDIKERRKVVSFLKAFDVAASALPHGVVHTSDVAATEAGAKMVNIAFEDDQMALDGQARETGAVLIPGCGVAPGGGVVAAPSCAAPSLWPACSTSEPRRSLPGMRSAPTAPSSTARTVEPSSVPKTGRACAE